MEFQKDGPNSFDDLLTELKESFRNFGFFFFFIFSKYFHSFYEQQLK